MKLIRTIIITVICALLLIYVSLYYSKILYYNFTEKKFLLGNSNDYILDEYYYKYNRYPVNQKQLREFLIENMSEFESSPQVEYLLKNSFGIKHDSLKQVYYVYDFGPNYRDDEMEIICNSKNTNIFNYLFRNGDVIIFYAKRLNSSKRSIKGDPVNTLPPNVTITVE